jgi:hypothetical protein
MSTLRQPPRRVSLQNPLTDRTSLLGVVGLRCRLSFFLERTPGLIASSIEFAVDFGASYSLIGLTLAQESGIQVPPPESEVELPLTTAQRGVTVRVRPGRIRGWWNEPRSGYPFDWPVLFRVDAPVGVPPILGLGGVVNTCTWTFDGRPTPESPFGLLTLEDTR